MKVWWRRSEPWIQTPDRYSFRQIILMVNWGGDIVKAIFDIYDKALKVLLCCATGGFIFICLLQVLFRFVLQNSLVWSQEACNLLFFISIFLGAAVCVTDRKHITIDLVLEYLPFRVKRYWYMVIYLIMFAFSVYMVFNGYSMAMTFAHQMTSTLKLSYFHVYLAIPVSCTLMAINVVRVAAYDFFVAYAPKNDPSRKKESEEI